MEKKKGKICLIVIGLIVMPVMPLFIDIILTQINMRPLFAIGGESLSIAEKRWDGLGYKIKVVECMEMGHDSMGYDSREKFYEFKSNIFPYSIFINKKINIDYSRYNPLGYPVK